MTLFWQKLAHDLPASPADRAISLVGHDFTCEFDGISQSVLHHFDDAILEWSTLDPLVVRGRHLCRGYRLADNQVLLDFRKVPNGTGERVLFLLDKGKHAGIAVTLSGKKRGNRSAVSYQARRASLDGPLTYDALVAFGMDDGLAGSSFWASTAAGELHWKFTSERESRVAQGTGTEASGESCEYVAYRINDHLLFGAFQAMRGRCAGAFAIDENTATMICSFSLPDQMQTPMFELVSAKATK